MAETEEHAQCLIDCRETLRAFFRDDPNVHVGSNLLFYYQEGDPRQSFAPAVFVTRGLARDRRLRTYRLWEVEVVPQFILELTSRGTRGEDLGAKRGLYEFLAIQEYFLFDPLEEYLEPPFQGYTLVRGRYRAIRPRAGGRLPSAVLGLELAREGEQLRFYDPARRQWLLTPLERAGAAEERAVAAEAAIATERERAAAAEAELARLRAELDRLRTGGD